MFDFSPLVIALFVGMARWRDEHEHAVRRARKVMKCSLGGADLSDKEAAALLGVKQQQLSRDLKSGGWLDELFAIADKVPAVRRQARAHLNDVFDEMEQKECEEKAS